ncbi:ankyrin repeat domain-containing protein [Fluoribacter dumoffii]|uniref:RasGEF domain-containing protein n=1 Tax=Fluoribacter dumoffii TaxID=463 RepID=UPI00026C8209|nr:RasGEF domain-containing protein [Fluoribacter dumoffii]MCW8385475.1 ankyrin repeat domain-containing protein [Fluoribacter dumoffii]MCW8418526.1 ankyrin repeat domain-containing protein [Fluoribacter dumoffii]MCW8453632.1 ankyrin repeat domain-containing protein [Fluoribacter dumoffii]MCW8459150.1 ankyrin repeat domain-containing protein [Fluoribacter dumoffii]MCW8482509.1 ankyrin repeat domain-containing protein [Fluoribacter dumoffii]
MNKEKIQELIFSDKDEKEIAAELIKWFTKNPELIKERYIFDRTVFHLLVLKNKPKVLEALFRDTTWLLMQDKPWRDIAVLGDRNNATVFHYAVRSEEDTETLKVLLEFIPELINNTNNLGNTPLHEAVLHHNVWAIQTLVNTGKCNRALKNEHEKTPLDMAGNNLDLRKALLSIDLSRIKSLDLRYRKSTPGSADKLGDSFPLLSSRSGSDYSSSPSTSLDSFHSSLRLQGETSPERDLSNLKIVSDQENAAVASSEQINLLLQELVGEYRVNKHSAEYLKAQKKFHELCKTNFFPEDFIFDPKLITHPEFQKVVSDAIGILYPSVDGIYTHFQEKINILMNQFIVLLIPHISLEDSKPREVPLFPEATPKKNQTLNLLWFLTACQDTPESKREFNLEQITNQALGVLGSTSLIEVLINLRALYVHFDADQKLIANLIVLQLLFYSAVNRIAEVPTLSMQLRFFCNINSDKDKGLGELGSQLNQHLKEVLELTSVYTNCPLLHNFLILNQQLRCPALIDANKSFDQLVNQALTKNRDNRVDEVLLIAHELRQLTITFYQKVSITEFNDGNWLKANKDILSPNIKELTDSFNLLSSYFCLKILSQPPENLKNALQFIIDLAQALCPLKGENYPDLNHMMLIAGILNNKDISRLYDKDAFRLPSAFRGLSTKDLHYLEEINKLISSDKNSKYMREVYGAFRSALPFLGLLLTEATFATDGNPNPLSRAEALGIVLKKILEVKLLINFEITAYQTNMTTFIKEFRPVDEESQYWASVRLQPRKADLLDLENNMAAIESVLDTLHKNFLPNNILPCIVINKKINKSTQTAEVLIDLYSLHLKRFKTDKQQGKNRDEIQQESILFERCFKKLKLAVLKIIEVNNQYYYELKLTDKKNPILFINLLDNLRKQLVTSEEFEELNTSRSSPKTLKEKPSKDAGKRKSVVFLDKNIFFKPEPKESDEEVTPLENMFS